MTNPSQLVQKLWNYCNILRDDGLSYGDYVEQLTFLLFLKMADEQSKGPFNKPSPIPKGFSWTALLKLDADDLETHYRHTLDELGKRTGMLGVIFRKAQNKIQDPAKLRRLIVDRLKTIQVSHPKVMILANAVAAAATQRDQVPLIQLKVGPAQGHTIVKRKDMMHLNWSEVAGAEFAADASRLPNWVLPDHFVPMGTAFNAVGGRYPRTVISALQHR